MRTRLCLFSIIVVLVNASVTALHGVTLISMLLYLSLERYRRPCHPRVKEMRDPLLFLPASPSVEHHLLLDETTLSHDEPISDESNQCANERPLVLHGFVSGFQNQDQKRQLTCMLN